MDRLTKRVDEWTYEPALNDGERPIDKFNDVLHALGRFEDVQEQERLVVLPCKIGERVYKTYNKYNAAICTCCMDMAGLGCECAFWDEEKCTCTNRPDRYGDYGIASVGFDYKHIPEIDKTIFLTHEAAESALKTKSTGGD